MVKTLLTPFKAFSIRLGCFPVRSARFGRPLLSRKSTIYFWKRILLGGPPAPPTARSLSQCRNRGRCCYRFWTAAISSIQLDNGQIYRKKNNGSFLNIMLYLALAQLNQTFRYIGWFLPLTSDVLSMLRLRKTGYSSACSYVKIVHEVWCRTNLDNTWSIYGKVPLNVPFLPQ